MHERYLRALRAVRIVRDAIGDCNEAAARDPERARYWRAYADTWEMTLADALDMIWNG